MGGRLAGGRMIVDVDNVGVWWLGLILGGLDSRTIKQLAILMKMFIPFVSYLIDVFYLIWMFIFIIHLFISFYIFIFWIFMPGLKLINLSLPYIYTTHLYSLQINSYLYLHIITFTISPPTPSTHSPWNINHWLLHWGQCTLPGCCCIYLDLQCCKH